ncbi:hypothetical protein NQ317_007473 [Molorchus minor]|uniref:Uncharacterized protein n=1 Tax=Molorchus minor TaxID=1323400 RepID=A0ABQ9K0U6_9CUCU|nr:hypothetical protein NQ317_007473 [Molorchus minor]
MYSRVKFWYPDPELLDPGPALKHYFTVACQSIISTDEDLRKMALRDISENAHIGPITGWFYHFGALDLIETLENSPLGSENVSEKQLKLLVRLLLQRLLLSHTTKEVLKSMSSVLALLCLREPLREMVIVKINQKTGLHHKTVLPILTIIYYLGIDAIRGNIFAKFNENDPDLSYVMLGIYGLLCKTEDDLVLVHNSFQAVFDDSLVIFGNHYDREKPPINFVNMKTQLLKMRRKVDCNIGKRGDKLSLENIFEIPVHNCRIKRIIDEHRKGIKYFKRETHITVGKTSLLLSVLKSNKNKLINECCDHTFLYYNF